MTEVEHCDEPGRQVHDEPPVPTPAQIAELLKTERGFEQVVASGAPGPSASVHEVLDWLESCVLGAEGWRDLSPEYGYRIWRRHADLARDRIVTLSRPWPLSHPLPART